MSPQTCQGPSQVPHLLHGPAARTIKPQALDSTALALLRGTSFSLRYPAGQENKLLNPLWAHLQDLIIPASTVGNPNHPPAPAKTRLKCLLVCTEGKSRNPGLSRWLQMFQMPACFTWGQPPEPHHSQENSSSHRRLIIAPEKNCLQEAQCSWMGSLTSPERLAYCKVRANGRKAGCPKEG